MPEQIRRRWFGTHFFNPPRYMRLVEIIPTPESRPRRRWRPFPHFADLRLGKEVVFARDTPNFIANRIGVFIMLEAVRLMQEEDLTIEEVDALTGTAIGWPRTGTFRLADLVGLDVLAHVASNFPPAPDGRKIAIPPFIQTMLERRWLGDKTGQGFYRKEKDAAGQGSAASRSTGRRSSTGRFRRPNLPALEMAKNAERLPERIRLLLQGDVRKDKAARFHWRLLTALWNYAADCLPEIADNVVQRRSRHARRLQLGDGAVPALGCRRRSRRRSTRMRAAGDAGEPRWRVGCSTRAPGPGIATADGVLRPRPAYRPCRSRGIARVADFRALERRRAAKRRALRWSISGDGVGCLELHSKKNAIGEDIVRLVTETLRADGDAVRDFSAFVISGDADNFSVGANLMQLLLSVQEGEWDEIDLAVRAFQRMTAAIKFCPRPVVVAPFGFCFGGGAEMALHAVRRQAHAELYMGLVECGVGLLPAGGGCKEMTLLQRGWIRDGGRSVEMQPAAEFRDRRHGQGFHLGGGGAPPGVPLGRGLASP